jgi:quercetin dioxygenase-like cupin family protein
VELQVVEHRLTEGDAIELKPARRVIYDIDDDAARFSTGGRGISGPAHLLSFELLPAASASALLSAPVDLPPGEERLIRCDRVDFPPGGVAYLHTHQGPGIRVLLHGAIRIETAGHCHDYRPLDAWFEPGPEPVFAAGSGTEPTAFVRCMVLPASLLGKRSIRYVRDEDAAKPKPQRYTVFVDEPLGESPGSL